MEISSFTSLAESSSSSSGVIDPVFQQWPVNSLEDPSSPSVPSFFSGNLHRSLSSDQSSFVNQGFIMKPRQGPKRITATNTRHSQAQDHVLAERKRREKLSQRFIALSALVPGLKKMDKATVLEDATKYMKHLQDKVKILEEQNKKASSSTNESLVFVKKYETSEEDTVTQPLPEIKARFCNKEVLITINCVKRKGVVEKTVSKIEKLHLSVVNTSVMSFGDSALSITVHAQRGDEFDMNMKELVDDVYAVVSEYSCDKN